MRGPDLRARCRISANSSLRHARDDYRRRPAGALRRPGTINAARRRIRFNALRPRELRLCTHRSLSIAAFARWWTMRRYLVRSGADFGFFLSLDLLCLPFALGLSMPGKPIAGILFRPSVHYGALGEYRPSSAERLRDLRKDLLYRLMLRNPSVRTVLSLDPFSPAHAVSRYRHGHKVQTVPDPAQPAMAPAAGDAAASQFVPPGRIGLLLFGYLTERKGPLMVLDALRLLPPAIASRAAVLLPVGSIPPSAPTSTAAVRRWRATGPGCG